MSSLFLLTKCLLNRGYWRNTVVSWPPASPGLNTTTEHMSARLGAHLLPIPPIPADNSSGELWMTSGSHYRLNFSQLVRWKGDAHCIQGPWNLTPGSVRIVIRGLCRCERQFAEVAPVENRRVMSSRRESGWIAYGNTRVDRRTWSAPGAYTNSLWPGLSHSHSLALRSPWIKFWFYVVESIVVSFIS